MRLNGNASYYKMKRLLTGWQPGNVEFVFVVGLLLFVVYFLELECRWQSGSEGDVRQRLLLELEWPAPFDLPETFLR